MRAGNARSNIDNPLVTIIVPVYNVAPYLREALDSVLAQTYENFEMIIIDDGSTDESGKICDEYAKDPRVQVVHQKNGGLSAARNAALERMNGELVVYLDPDDAYRSEYLRSLVDAKRESGAPLVMCRSANIVTEGGMILRGNEQVRPKIGEGVYDRKAALRALAEGKINCVCWNKLYEASLWENLRFPVGRVYEDVSIMYQILDQCEMVCVLDEVFYLHRERTTSISGQISGKKHFDYLWALSQFEDYIIDHQPEIFSAKHLDWVRNQKMNQYIDVYGVMLRKKSERTGHDQADVRSRIVETGKMTDVSRLSKRKRMAYYLIRYCPHYYRLHYSLFCALKWLKQVNLFQIRTYTSICSTRSSSL